MRILITGANRGIGLALTKEFVRRGAEVFACCRKPEKFESLGAVQALPLRVDDPKSIAELAHRLNGEAVDVLINNAGIIGHPIERQMASTIDFSSWEEILRINTLGPARVLQAFLPHLKRAAQPKVMNVTSDLGALSHDDPILFGYSASKAALNKFMRLASIELKADGIAIGLVHPGWVQTDMGGANAPVDPTTSASGIAKVIDSLSLENTGGFWNWNGSQHEW